MRKKVLIALVAAAAITLGAMWWILHVVLSLESGERAARRQAAREERLRLALWRMDSSLATFLAFENGLPLDISDTHRAAQPGFVARRFEVTSVAEAQTFLSLLAQPPLEPGPPPPSPPPPTPPTASRPPPPPPSPPTTTSPAPARGSPPDDDEVTSRIELEKLPAARDPWAIVTQTPGVVSNRIEFERRNELRGQQAAFSTVAPNRDEPEKDPSREDPLRDSPRPDVAPSPNRPAASVTGPTGQRDEASDEASDEATDEATDEAIDEPRSSAAPTGVVRTLEPLWSDDRLFLVRRIARGGKESLQGVELDDGALRAWLLDQVQDHFDGAWLVPIEATDTDRTDDRLAMLPYRLIPGTTASQPAEIGASPGRIGVILALGSMLLVALGTALVVIAAMRVARQRSAFASAVIHELRTPLTTFRLYTDMLAEGAVPEADRSRYIDTLRREGDRLGHLVENVLAYARLEKSRRPRAAPLELVPCLRDIASRLTERAQRDGKTLDLELESDAEAVHVAADPVSLERILVNLCDNSCKYTDEGAHLALSLSVRGRRALLTWRDDGPGLTLSARRKLNRRQLRGKGATVAAGDDHHVSGLGLGLALCGQLARGLGGKIRAVDTKGAGARIELSLPIVDPPAAS